MSNVKYIGDYKVVDMNNTLTPHEHYLFKQIDKLRDEKVALEMTLNDERFAYQVLEGDNRFIIGLYVFYVIATLVAAWFV